MICTNCGSDIPFNGKVCPYCRADKSRDQIALAIVVISTIVAGGLGMLIFDWPGMIAGLVGGAIFGSVISYAKSPTQPQEPEPERRRKRRKQRPPVIKSYDPDEPPPVRD